MLRSRSDNDTSALLRLKGEIQRGRERLQERLAEVDRAMPSEGPCEENPRTGRLYEVFRFADGG